MVRDEVIESEPDIEDIDSTLEQIDEQSATFETIGVAVSEPEAVATGSIDANLEAGASSSEDSLGDSTAATGSIDPVATAPGSDTHFSRLLLRTTGCTPATPRSRSQ
jgi:hypothetical protein